MKFERHPEKHEQIGVGGYKRAYKISEDGRTPEVQLVMKHKYTNEQMKGLFYLNKIATILFPGKIAAVSASGNFFSEEGGVESSQFRTKYHEHDPVHKSMQHHAKVFDGKYAAENDEQEESLERFWDLSEERDKQTQNHQGIEEFREAYHAAGFENEQAAVHVYWGSQDVIIDEKGNFVYVDIDVPWDEPEEVGQGEHNNRCLRFDPEKLRTAIASLEEPDRERAEGYYTRLIELARQTGFSL